MYSDKTIMLTELCYVSTTTATVATVFIFAIVTNVHVLRVFFFCFFKVLVVLLLAVTVDTLTHHSGVLRQ